ncbi:hypothetical protein [Caldiplasma sukawensis]
MTGFLKRYSENKEYEQKMKVESVRIKAENLANHCDILSKKYNEMGNNADAIGNQTLAKTFREKEDFMKKQSARIRSFILLMDDVSMMKGQFEILSGFSSVIRDFIGTLSRKNKSAWISQMEKNFEMAMIQSDKITAAFKDLLDVSENSDLATTLSEMQKEIDNVNKEKV